MWSDTGLWSCAAIAGNAHPHASTSCLSWRTRRFALWISGLAHNHCYALNYLQSQASDSRLAAMNLAPASTDNLPPAFAAYLTAERLRAPRTAHTYSALVAEFVRHTGTVTAAVESNRLTIQQFLGSSQRAIGDVALARGRWNLRLSALRAWYGFLAARGLVCGDPTAGIVRQRVPRRDPQPLSMAELVALVRAVDQQSPGAYRARNVAIVQVLIHTALRVGELAALDVVQVDASAGVLGSVRRKGGKCVAAWLNPTATCALVGYLAERANLHPLPGEPALFVSHTGARMAVRSVQEMVSKYARLAGIRRRVTPHLLRHSAATQLAALGTPIRTIQEICAHSSVATTQLYVTVAAQDRIDAAARLGAAFEMEILKDNK